MAAIEDGLQALLSDPDTLGRILTLAQALGGGNTSANGTDGASGQAAETGRAVSASPAAARPLPPGGESTNPAELREGQNAALLTALRPYLAENKRGYVDQALALMQAARLLRLGLSFLKGGEQLV
jgi:hypothetical protein